MYLPPEIGENGAWTTWVPKHHRHDNGLIANLIWLFEGRTVIDVGCGDGAYTEALQTAGVDCEGYDASPIRPTGCGYLDLSRPIKTTERFDWVLCLEVGEHIPAAYQQTVFDNLDKLARKGIVMSWAVEGQTGYGHVNERNNDYIERIMNSYGFERYHMTEQTLRDGITDLPWMKDTVMVYARR